MSWLFSQALVEAYWEESSWDGEPYAQLNVMPTPHKFWRNDKTMESSRLSQFGLTLHLLTEDRGAALLTWFLEASLAKTLAQPAEVTDSTESEADSGRKWLGLLARFDHDTRSWKTPQCSLLEGLDEYSETWPRWGSMRNGECWERQTLELNTNETESGLWPTPNCIGFRSDGELLLLSKKLEDRAEYLAMSSRAANSKRERFWPTPTASNTKAHHMRSGGREARSYGAHGQLNPDWIEWLMGWPIGWTELKPLAMDRFREWQEQHSLFSKGHD